MRVDPRTTMLDPALRVTPLVVAWEPISDPTNKRGSGYEPEAREKVDASVYQPTYRDESLNRPLNTPVLVGASAILRAVPGPTRKTSPGVATISIKQVDLFGSSTGLILFSQGKCLTEWEDM